MVQLNCIKFILFIYFIISDLPFLYGFVLLYSSEPKLPISANLPEVEFALTNNPPSIGGKSEFLNGKYADLDDEAFFRAVVQEAMDRWNNVKGSYLKFVISNTKIADNNTDDRVNSIVVGKVDLSSSAFAKPIVEDNTIVDCDITISSSIKSAKSFAYALMHELGHCLGLGHNHTNYDSVMGYFRTDYELRLGADDIAGLIYLYPDPKYNNSKPKELISCGTIRSFTNKNHSYLILVTLVILPIFLCFLACYLTVQVFTKLNNNK